MRRMGFREGVLSRVAVSVFISGLCITLLFMYSAVGFKIYD